jgi:hypothetical protein
MSSSAEHGSSMRSSDGRSLDEQARRKGVQPIRSVEDLACVGIFETDESPVHLAKLRRTRPGLTGHPD